MSKSQDAPVSGAAHDGVDLVAWAAFQEVAPEMAVGLAMTDDGLDGGSPPEFAFDLSVNAALLARFEDPARLRRVVTHITRIHIGALDLAAGERLGFLDDLPQGVAVIGVSGERLGVEDELAALIPSSSDTDS